jgi:hypothetical protein
VVNRPLFLFKVYLFKKNKMLFLCSFTNNVGVGVNKYISGTSWNEVISYCETTQLTLKSINISQQNLIINDTQQKTLYNLGVKDEITKFISQYTIYDSYTNVLNWINNQQEKTLVTLSSQKIEFVKI